MLQEAAAVSLPAEFSYPDRMRVLHLYSGNLFGGIESLIVRLAEDQRKFSSSMEMNAALCFEGRLSHQLRELGVEPFILGEVRVSRPWTIWRARARLRRVLEEKQFDAAICHSAWPQAIFGPIVRAAKVPLFFWLHDAATGKNWLERWVRWITPDFVICNSQYTRSTLPQLYPDSPSTVLYCPVSVTLEPSLDPAATRSEHDTARDAVVIIQVSRMQAWKGQSSHLKALAELKDVPNWVCWQVGGPQRSQEEAYFRRLQEEARLLGISQRVRFFGHCPDVGRLLAAADVFCQPNESPEPFGVSLVEAMHCGLPVVTTAMGGALETVLPSCGILVPPQDVHALSGALKKMICDGSLRSRMGKEGRRRAQEISDPQVTLQRLEAIIRSKDPSVNP